MSTGNWRSRYWLCVKRENRRRPFYVEKTGWNSRSKRSGDGRIHQFCIRSGDREEFTFAKMHTEMHKFDFSGLEALTAELCRTQVPVYLTIDLDCLDPSCFPGTGTPEAGGMTFMQLLNAIFTVSKTNIIGADVNELAPMLDASGVSTAMACKVLRELLLALNV